MPFIALYAGTASPVALFFALIIMLIVANTVSEFSKYMPSTGGYYTFVTKGLGSGSGSSPGGATSPMTRWGLPRCSGSWATWPRTCSSPAPG